MSVNPSTFGPCPQFENSAGQPAVGDKLFFYAAGTTTKQNTYTDSTGTVANTNPVVLNALGQPSTQIWFTNGESYKVVWAPSTDTDPPTSPIRTFDNLRGINDTTVTLSNSEWILSSSIPTYIGATSFTVAGNQTSILAVGRRLKTTNTSGTIYSTIISSVYTTLTTITVINDSGVLDSGISNVSYGILSPISPSVPNAQTFRQTMGLGYGADIASAATLPLASRTGNIVDVSGTVTTTATDLENGGLVWCRALAAWPLTYHATNMPLQGGANYVCSAGDTVMFYRDRTGVLTVLIFKKDGTPVISPISGENRLINGAMQVDQRNAGAAQTFTAGAALAYCVDQWYGYCAGSSSVTGQQVAGTSPNQYNYRFTGAASVTKIGFAQRIEAANCQDMAGNTAILSVDLANSLLTTVTWTAWYANTTNTFGTLASPTRTLITSGTFTVNSTLSRYSTAISIPSAATTGIEIEFSVGAQTSGTWTIGRAQFEKGTSASPFQVQPISEVLLSCYRYFWELLSDIRLHGYNTASGEVNQFIGLPTEMYTVPTVTAITGAASASTMSIQNISKNGFTVQAVATSAGVFYTTYSAGNAASAVL